MEYLYIRSQNDYRWNAKAKDNVYAKQLHVFDGDKHNLEDDLESVVDEQWRQSNCQTDRPDGGQKHRLHTIAEYSPVAERIGDLGTFDDRDERQMPGRWRPEEDENAAEVERESAQTLGVEVEKDHEDAGADHEDAVSQVTDAQRRNGNRSRVLLQLTTSRYEDGRKNVDYDRSKRQRHLETNHHSVTWHSSNRDAIGSFGLL